MEQIKVSGSFRKKAIVCALFIFLFLAIYLLVIAAGIGIAFLFGTIALYIIDFNASAFTLIIALSLVASGGILIYFLLKFLFRIRKQNLEGYIEVKESDQPKLFSMIAEINQATGTRKPAHVYLNNSVNAFVMYNSTLLSLIFPVRKNLVVGMGLINSLTQQELKAVLAHEFGHFSQKSMRIGSYVYSANRMIVSILFENDSINSIISTLSNSNGLVQFVMKITVYIIRYFQGILRKAYTPVQKSHNELSHEMEFNADEIAASVAGSEHLAKALNRLQFADESYNEIFNFYNFHYPDGLITDNIYENHTYVMAFIGKKNNFSNEHGYFNPLDVESVPDATSRLRFDLDYDTHPPQIKRISRLKELNYKTDIANYTSARSCITNPEKVESEFSRMIFKSEFPEKILSKISNEEFIRLFDQYWEKQKLPDPFNTYYSIHEPLFPEPDKLIEVRNTELSELLTEDLTKNIFEFVKINTEIAQLESIIHSENEFIEFWYNNVQKNINHAVPLLAELQKEKEYLNRIFEETDGKIANYFYTKSMDTGKQELFIDKYQKFQHTKKELYSHNTNSEILSKASIVFSIAPDHPDFTFYLKQVTETESAFKKDIDWLIGIDLDNWLNAEQVEILKNYNLSQPIQFSGSSGFTIQPAQNLLNSLAIYNYAIGKMLFRNLQSFLLFLDNLNIQSKS